MSELERKLLAKITTPEELAEAWEIGIRAEHFEEPIFQAIWNFTVDYWHSSQGKAVPTVWALQEEFPTYAPVQAPEETFYLAEKLRMRWTANGIQEVMRTVAPKTLSDPMGALKEMAAAAYSLGELTVRRATRTNLADTVERRRSDYAQRQDYPQGLGAPYGLDLLDLHTGGLLPGELCILGARAKTGKTMLGLHAMVSALKQGYKPLVFSLEMSLKEIEKRIDCLFSGVSYDRLLHGRLCDEELERLHTAQDELVNLGGIQVEMPEEGDRTVGSLLARTRQFGANYVFIDQLTFMEPGQKVQSLKEHHATIVKALKINISRPGQEIPCILAHQMRRDDEELSMASFSNATEIEQTADILLGLSRNQDLYNNAAMLCEILGSRRSDHAKFLLQWQLKERTHIAAQEQLRG
jgi:replicative DNA helicase